MNIQLPNSDVTDTLSFTVADGSDPLRLLHVVVVRPVRKPKVEVLQPNMHLRRSIIFLGENDNKNLSCADAFIVLVSRSTELARNGLLLRVPFIDRAYQLLETPNNITCSSGNEDNCSFDLPTNGEISFDGESAVEISRDEMIVPVLSDTIKDTVSAWTAKACTLITQEGSIYDEEGGEGTLNAQEDTSTAQKETLITPKAALLENTASSIKSQSRKISMKRPVSAQPVLVLPPRPTIQYNISPQNEQSPQDFLVSRYYNTLYSLTTPLSYFPKTALSRLRHMCKDIPDLLKAALSTTLLSKELLILRQQEKMGLSTLVTEGSSPLRILKFEHENQQVFASRHYVELASESKFDKLVMQLKIREAQLQILVLMELLLCLNIDEADFLRSNAKNVEKQNALSKKPSLVRRRKSQRIIPTLLGQGFIDLDPQSSIPDEQNPTCELSLYKFLLSLLDQLGIWGVLLGKSDSKSDDHTYGFLAYVLVPYYNKTLPLIVQFIIKSFKSFHLSLKVPKKASRLASTPTDPAEALPSSSSSTKHKLKFSKTLLSKEKIPLLKKSSSSIEASDLQHPLLLKRSKSSLSAKNMQKRQVDVLGSKQMGKSEELVDLDLKSQPLFLFCDARKIKTASISQPNTLETPQVEATPRKQTLSRSINGSNFISSIPQVEATPTKARSATDLGSPEVFATPMNYRISDRGPEEYELPDLAGSGKRKGQLSVYEKLAIIEMERVPTEKDSINGTVLSEHDVHGNSSNEAVIESSPLKIISSPFKPSNEFTGNNSAPATRIHPDLNRLPPGNPKKRKRRSLKRVSSKATNNQVRSPEKIIPQTTKPMPKSQDESVEALETKALETKMSKPLGSLSHAPTGLSSLDIFKETSVSPAQVNPVTISKAAKASSHSFNFHSGDTDLDSDLEKLVAAPRAPIKKYPRRK